MTSRSALAIDLSKLDVFEQADVSLEQYPTDSEIAATVLWQAHMNRDILDKKVADLGSGTGILGIGALILGAKFVYFVEKDEKAVEILKKNLENIEGIERKHQILHMDVDGFKEKADVVIENPPFGTKEKHADKMFLEKAFSTAKTVYSFHKTSTKKFIEKISEDHGFSIAEQIDFSFPIKASQKYHRKKVEKIEVSCFRFVKE